VGALLYCLLTPVTCRVLYSLPHGEVCSYLEHMACYFAQRVVKPLKKQLRQIISCAFSHFFSVHTRKKLFSLPNLKANILKRNASSCQV